MGPTQSMTVLAATQSEGASVLSLHPAMATAAIVCAVIAAALLLWFLLWKPALTGQVRFLLLLGFGVFPIGAAMTGNIAGFEHTKNRPFCGSCHVMAPYSVDAADVASLSLAASHARNEAFGPTNCYECHREYGAFSTVLTKIGGMRHVFAYYTHYYKVPVDQALREMELYKPMPNASCMRCHSTEVALWNQVGEHRSSLAEVRSGRLSCASAGCHGPAHPFSKRLREADQP